MIDRLYSSPDKVPFKRFTVVTDSICINSIWASGASDFYIVPNRPTLEALKVHGVPLSSILDLGFPVSLKFANCQIPRNIPPPWHILYMPGGSWGKIEETIRQLSQLPNVVLTLAAGKNEQNVASLNRLIKQLGSSANVIGWVDDMPERLLRQHLVIGKAGGAIVQETIAAGCPMIISQVVPGQEEGNVSLILQQGVGAVAEEPEQLKNLLNRAMQNEGALWRTWKSNLLAIQRPLAAQTIARFVLGRLNTKQ
jgi:processive 1,2-diacylglycerol beta-glucosyltransferase